MVLSSSLAELMEDQMLEYGQIGLNINDRAFIYRNKHPHPHTLTHTNTHVRAHTHTHTHI